MTLEKFSHFRSPCASNNFNSISEHYGIIHSQSVDLLGLRNSSQGTICFYGNREKREEIKGGGFIQFAKAIELFGWTFY